MLIQILCVLCDIENNTNKNCFVLQIIFQVIFLILACFIKRFAIVPLPKMYFMQLLN